MSVLEMIYILKQVQTTPIIVFQNDKKCEAIKLFFKDSTEKKSAEDKVSEEYKIFK